MSEATDKVSKHSDTKDILKSLLISNKLPSHVKTVEDAFTIAQMGKELGFPVMQALHYIIPIQGKLSLSAKAVGAILRKNKITFVTKEDALYVFADGSTSEYNNIEGKKPIDRRTTITFTRDGVSEDVSFTWKNAELQGLTSKDNWQRMPSEMLYSRCLAKGSNRIAQDFLLGLYTAEEITDSFNISEKNIKRNDDGTVASVIEDITHSEVK
jgi:hypothetical protein